MTARPLFLEAYCCILLRLHHCSLYLHSGFLCLSFLFFTFVLCFCRSLHILSGPCLIGKAASHSHVPVPQSPANTTPFVKLSSANLLTKNISTPSYVPIVTLRTELL